MSTPRVRLVAPLQDKRLLVTFTDGLHRIYDCHSILTLECFQLLKHESFFKAIKVDPGGYGVSWDDQMDLSEYELWHNGVEVEPSTV